MEKDLIVSNYAKYKKRLVAYIGEDITGSIIDRLGGEDTIMNATFASKTDTGLAYEGAFCKTILNLTAYAVSINELLPESRRADKNSIVKVCLLSQIAKVIMYEDNKNEWEKEKRGIPYGFVDLEGALRTGERSALIAMSCGVQFTEDEYEAMLIMDKEGLNDNYTKYFSSVLSMVIRQSNEIITTINKQ